MIMAGEISGDMHGARLVEAIKERRPDATFFGIGGDKMRRAGVETFYDVKDMAVMGFTEVIRRFGFFKHVFNEMLDKAQAHRPDAVILVDYPGFNLRFAAKVHALGLKTIYYICPQIWAWDRSRIPRMARVVDRLITIFPFEEKYFDGTGLKVDFIGHPLVDEAKKTLKEPEPELPWNGEPRVAVLPGSRAHEIERMFPVMWSASALIEQRYPEAGFIVAAPSSREADILRDKVKQLQGGPSRWSIVTGNTRQILRQAKAAMVASGTATIEAALMSCPMVIAYKMGGLTYLLARMLVKVDHIGMVNIVAGKKVCPEFIQDAVTSHALAEAINPLVNDDSERATMIEELKRVEKALGTGAAEDKAADIVIQTLDEQTP